MGWFDRFRGRKQSEDSHSTNSSVGNNSATVYTKVTFQEYLDKYCNGLKERDAIYYADLGNQVIAGIAKGNITSIKQLKNISDRDGHTLTPQDAANCILWSTLMKSYELGFEPGKFSGFPGFKDDDDFKKSNVLYEILSEESSIRFSSHNIDGHREYSKRHNIVEKLSWSDSFKKFTYKVGTRGDCVSGRNLDISQSKYPRPWKFNTVLLDRVHKDGKDQLFIKPETKNASSNMGLIEVLYKPNEAFNKKIKEPFLHLVNWLRAVADPNGRSVGELDDRREDKDKRPLNESLNIIFDENGVSAVEGNEEVFAEVFAKFDSRDKKYALKQLRESVLKPFYLERRGIERRDDIMGDYTAKNEEIVKYKTLKSVIPSRLYNLKPKKYSINYYLNSDDYNHATSKKIATSKMSKDKNSLYSIKSSKNSKAGDVFSVILRDVSQNAAYSGVKLTASINGVDNKNIAEFINAYEKVSDEVGLEGVTINFSEYSAIAVQKYLKENASDISEDVKGMLETGIVNLPKVDSAVKTKDESKKIKPDKATKSEDNPGPAFLATFRCDIPRNQTSARSVHPEAEHETPTENSSKHGNSL